MRRFSQYSTKKNDFLRFFCEFFVNIEEKTSCARAFYDILYINKLAIRQKMIFFA
jgi:hypothetical protein